MFPRCRSWKLGVRHGHPHESIRHTHDTHGLCRNGLPRKLACGPTLQSLSRGARFRVKLA